MKTEASISDFSLAHQMYPPAVRYLIQGFQKKTREDARQDWWDSSFSNSSVYSKNLGILLADPEAIVIKNSAMEFLSKTLEENPIKALIERKQQEGTLYMLDLMSYGAVHRELGVAGCAVALSDRRNEERMHSDNNEIDKTLGIQFVDGDVLCGCTWGRINKYLAAYGIDEGFGVILCHPIGALDNIPQNIDVYRYIFNHVYKILNPNEGIFLANFHPDMYEQVEKMSRQLNTIDGIEATCYPAHFLSLDSKFMLKRFPNSPDRLPILTVNHF